MEVSRFFVELSFNGSGYHGWQRQPNALSVQQTLEEAFSRLLREQITLVGAGRTDAGVHADQMFAHFDSSSAPINCEELVFLMNGFLPNDIALKKISKVHAQAHARFDATHRSYKYYITTIKDPFRNNVSYYLKNVPDVALMNQAAKILFEHEDFQCFSRSNTDVKTFLCKIKEAKWTQEGSSIVFHIVANRFLRNMVRAIVGTFLEIGFKKKTLQDLEDIIKSKDRGRAGFSAPAQGLFLSEISYPSKLFID